MEITAPAPTSITVRHVDYVWSDGRIDQFTLYPGDAFVMESDGDHIVIAARKGTVARNVFINRAHIRMRTSGERTYTVPAEPYTPNGNQADTHPAPPRQDGQTIQNEP